MSERANWPCRRCGCALGEDDVRQLALYYREGEPSTVAAQYECPRCRTTEWRQYEPTDWATFALGPWDRASLADAPGQPAAPRAERAVIVDSPRESPPPIDLDEYIDFACRLARLGPADLAGLAAPRRTR